MALACTVCEVSWLYFHLSKTVAEQVAANLAEEQGIELVSLHLGFLLGPLLQPFQNVNSKRMLNFVKHGMMKVVPCSTLLKLR